MDDLTLLRKMRDDVERPTDAYLTRGRDKLLTQIHASLITTQPQLNSAEPQTHRSSRFTQRLRRSVLAVTAAAVLAAALVVSDVVGLPGQPPLNAEAVAVLEDAAAASIQTSDPVVADGEYQLVETKAVSLASLDGATFTTLTTEQMYIPADRDEDWVWFRPISQPYESFGPGSQAASEKHFASVYAGIGQDYVEKLRAPAGQWYGHDSELSSEALSDLPRDPDRLLDFIHRTTRGGGASQDAMALDFIADRLRLGALPADVRAVLYQAVALIPGVEFVEDQATLDGRTGTAIGWIDTRNNFRRDLIIDPDTGVFIGERTTQLAALDWVSANTVTSWTSVTSTVVPDAPTGGTQNGYQDDEGCTIMDNGGAFCPP